MSRKIGARQIYVRAASVEEMENELDALLKTTCTLHSTAVNTGTLKHIEQQFVLAKTL